MTKKLRGINTTIIHNLHQTDRSYGAVSTPVIPAVAYSFPNIESAIGTVQGKDDNFYYGRFGNPTTRKLEEKITQLEGGEDSLAVSSGMAAISISILYYLSAGDHLLVTKDVYGGTHHFLTNLANKFGIQYSFVDCTNFEDVESNIQTNTKALYLETPSNPSLTILDIEQLSIIAHKHELGVIVDNTFMTPLLQTPLTLGADIVVHSATKYINGHGDVIAGIIAGKQNVIAHMRKNLMGDLGQNLNAWESYLILRGMKTLGIRMQKHVENAEKVAHFLNEHPAVKVVHYPGLNHHPQHDIAKKQMNGMGGIVSFELIDGYDACTYFVNSLKLVMISFSLGDPETLVQHPASMTHSSIPLEELEQFNLSSGLIRLSIGLEDSEDILEDINQALNKLTHKEMLI